MKRTLLITADDYGLSRRNVDTILETVDQGGVTNLSVLANGDAVEYGIGEYAKRAAAAGMSLHLNLTEGRALSTDSSVRALTDREGRFRYSVGRLWLAYILSSRAKKEAFREGARAEIKAQLARIGTLLKEHTLALGGVDGHQHVHMIPFVFDALVAENPPYVRIPSEPWYIVPHRLDALFSFHALARILLSVLSLRNKKAAEERGIRTPSFFLGFVFSGTMTYEVVEEGLHAILLRRKGEGSVEVCVHPGSIVPGELGERANVNASWYGSAWRARERALLISDGFKALCSAYLSGTLVGSAWYRSMPKLLRFGISGATAAATQLILLFLLTEYAGIWYLLSNILAFSCSFVVSFMLQKFWTFEDASRTHAHRQAGSYLMLQLGNLAVNSLLLSFLVERAGMGYLPAEFLVLILVAFGTFFVSHTFIFKRAS